jgi:3-methyladenine DNA glycosylase AlkD
MKNMKSKVPAQEVEAALRKLSTGGADVEASKRYMGTGYDMIGGLPVPMQRSIARTGFSFSNLQPNDQLKIWDDVWKESELFEVMSQCLVFVQRNIKKLDRDKLWAVTKGWVKKIDNWGHSDMLSGIYAWLLEQDEEMVYPQLVKWNSSRNPWERRQSLVSIFEYSSKRSGLVAVNKVLILVSSLLHDDHKFVQKAVGWTLREAGNVYPAETWQFLVKHHKELSAIAYSAAIEKRTPKEKEELKAMRKAARGK